MTNNNALVLLSGGAVCFRSWARIGLSRLLGSSVRAAQEPTGALNV